MTLSRLYSLFLARSVAVVFASGFTAKGWYRVDPACSVVMNGIILVEAFSLMKRTSEILLLRSPQAYVQVRWASIPKNKLMKAMFVLEIETGDGEAKDP